VSADTQALVDRVVLAVDGQDGNIALAGGCGQDFAGGNHAFLVGQADWFSGEDGRMGGFESRDPDDGRDDKVCFRVGRAGDGSCAAVDHLRSRDPSLVQALAETGGEFFCRKRDHLRPPADCLGESFVDIAAGSEGRDLVSIGKLLDDGKGALADGAGRSEDGKTFQCPAKSNRDNNSAKSGCV
jgi:hypothetical protein